MGGTGWVPRLATARGKPGPATTARLPGCWRVPAENAQPVWGLEQPTPLRDQGLAQAGALAPAMPTTPTPRHSSARPQSLAPGKTA